MDQPVDYLDPTRFIDLNYELISLGYNCYPRQLPERMHLFNFRKTRETRMPFDGCNTSYHGMCQYIETKFSTYGADAINHPGNPKEILLPSTGTVLNHEITKDVSSVQIQLRRRADQFVNLLDQCKHTGKPMVFFLFYNGGPPTQIDTILKKTWPGLKYRICCVNTEWTNTYSQTQTDTYTHATIPFPNQTYDIHSGYLTEQGEQFEKKCVQELLHCIAQITGTELNVDQIHNRRSHRYQFDFTKKPCWTFD